MANYARLGRPQGASPLHSPPARSPNRNDQVLYAPQPSGSASSSQSNLAQYPGGTRGGVARYDPSVTTGTGSSGKGGYAGETSVGGHEFGPYAPLNRRPHGSASTPSSHETDASTVSTHERLLKNGAGGGAVLSGATTVGVYDAYDVNKPEPDDYLHDPRGADKRSHKVSLRGALNIATLLFLVFGLLMLFAGYPIMYHLLTVKEGNKGAYGLGGTNGTGQVAQLSALRGLIDPDTPASARTFKSTQSGKTFQLQFSDEFEKDGRTFWPGDDPYWEAVDIWYGGTEDYEWYSPENVNTTGGALVITMTDKPAHNLNFQSGMVQSWNKLCYTGGYLEFSIIQPGSHSTQGYWPGAWIFGNLGRPGYLGTTDGMWPYSYQGCDTGILPNQTNAQGGPNGAVNSKAAYSANGQLSKLPGMRTPSCTCSGEDHPGPNVKIGRSAPEIDVLEAQIQSRGGVKDSYASQSLQTAPYDDAYDWSQTSPAAVIHGDNTQFNTYTGGPYQESVSSVSLIPRRGFVDYDAPDAEKYVTFGLEYEPDYDFNGGGYVTWYEDGQPTWTATGATIPARVAMEISQRIIPTEPMSIVMNLGMSSGFQTVDFDAGGVAFPAQMKFDYVRVFQEKGKEKMSCDPADYPTAKYIADHIEVYSNANITRWPKAMPKNRLTGC